MAAERLSRYTSSMVRVEIDLPRPGSALFWSAAFVAAIVYYTGGDAESQKAELTAEGGSDKPVAVAVQQAEEDGKELRLLQEVLSRREDILRSELQVLEAQRSDDPDYQKELASARERLSHLLLNKREAEQELTQSLNQIWEAQGFAMRLSVQGGSSVRVTFDWPAQPLMGLSARFDDAGYQERFGIPHQAIDIPMPQGSVITASADGVIAKVTDRGLGFNSIVIKHRNGMATLYGHVSKFLVSEGDEVEAGEAIALSGGTPGTAGAGHMTTGAHLHFQMLKDGSPVDPLGYLPKEDNG
jgi:murein DD-endopeptidase MepM/ murein hydrolase activator NlpD